MEDCDWQERSPGLEQLAAQRRHASPKAKAAANVGQGKAAKLKLPVTTWLQQATEAERQKQVASRGAAGAVGEDTRCPLQSVDLCTSLTITSDTQPCSAALHEISLSSGLSSGLAQEKKVLLPPGHDLTSHHQFSTVEEVAGSLDGGVSMVSKAPYEEDDRPSSTLPSAAASYQASSAQGDRSPSGGSSDGAADGEAHVAAAAHTAFSGCAGSTAHLQLRPLMCKISPFDLLQQANGQGVVSGEWCCLEQTEKIQISVMGKKVRFEEEGRGVTVCVGEVEEDGVIRGSVIQGSQDRGGVFEFKQVSNTVSGPVYKGTISFESESALHEINVAVCGATDVSKGKSARFNYAKALIRLHLLIAFENMVSGGFVH